jgi:hypothetical protein
MGHTNNFRSITGTAVLTLGLLGFAASAALAQEAKKRENVEYFSMTYVDYKAGKNGAANDIIENHFNKAGEASGTPGPITLHFQSGKYDAAFYWKQEGGLADLEWWPTPNGAKWWAAMIEQEGSEKNAEKIMAKYNATIASQLRVIGHRHVEPDEE